MLHYKRRKRLAVNLRGPGRSATEIANALELGRQLKSDPQPD
jgi:hypothetical protein